MKTNKSKSLNVEVYFEMYLEQLKYANKKKDLPHDLKMTNKRHKNLLNTNLLNLFYKFIKQRYF